MVDRDLREWIEQADKLGELKRISGADWNVEIGAVTELGHHRGEPTRLSPKAQEELSSRAITDAWRPYQWLNDSSAFAASSLPCAVPPEKGGELFFPLGAEESGS